MHYAIFVQHAPNEQSRSKTTKDCPAGIKLGFANFKANILCNICVYDAST